MLRKTVALTACLLVIGSSAFAQTQGEKVLDKKLWTVGSLLIGSTIYDVESTYFAFDKCVACYEKNPRMRPFVKAGKPWLYAVQGSIDAGVIYASYKMKDKDHKLWYLLPVALTVVHISAGMHNIRVAIKF
ncbi:MAG: hypothetical protein G01um10142_404 [Parcubacteria group bacterium Gr01-1014_2]|nr:MAG: hypothetical protein G01um10142_404 [Parcubacteria group bacterium Gr01-1014_2]